MSSNVEEYKKANEDRILGSKSQSRSMKIKYLAVEVLVDQDD